MYYILIFQYQPWQRNISGSSNISPVLGFFCGINLVEIPHICGHNPTWSVFLRVQNAGRSQNAMGTVGIRSGIGDPNRNL